MEPEPAVGDFDHADHGQVHVVHADRAADRVLAAGKQIQPDLLGEDAYLALLLHVDFVEKPAEPDRLRADLLKIGIVSYQAVIAFFVVPAEFVFAAPDDRADAADVGHLFFDRSEVLVLELPVTSGREPFVGDRGTAAPEETGVDGHIAQL